MEGEVDSAYLALGIINWQNQSENFDNCIKGRSSWRGPMKSKECQQWLGFSPLKGKKLEEEFNKRYGLFKYFDTNSDGKLMEREFLHNTKNLYEGEEGSHYELFVKSLQLYGKQFCKDPRVRPFETEQSICERETLEKLAPASDKQ